MEYSAKVNDSFQFEPADLADAAIERIAANRYHVLLADGRALQLEVASADPYAKQYRIFVKGRAYEVQLFDELDRRIVRLGLGKAATTGGGDVLAPMPGLVREILVSEGQEVTADEPVLVLEAMKMENLIKAPATGTVQTISVTAGQAVEKKAVLLVIGEPAS
jgi:biotin carboxyl carrier protein